MSTFKQDAVAVIDLSPSRGRLRVAGDDAEQFLQGQCTNDIKRLAPGDSCYAAFLTAKGKMRGEADIIRTDNAYLLSTGAAHLQELQNTLEKFIITEDVSISDITPQTREWGAWGLEVDSPQSYPNRMGGINVWDDWEGFETAVANGATQLSAADLETRRIESGIPLYGIDMDETTIPVEAGLAAWAISYDKGCYIGQETIARIKTYGHVNRHLVQIAAADMHAPGTVIRAGDKDIGQVTSAVQSPKLGKPLLLGYVRREFAVAGCTVNIEQDIAEVLRLCGT